MPDGWTWVHYKVLELAYDRTPIPELCGLHQYFGATLGDSVVPATTVDDTRAALTELISAGAVRLRRSEFASEGSLVRHIALNEDEACAVLANDSLWDEAGEEGWVYEIAETVDANALFDARPAELNPHRPARRVTDAPGREPRLVEIE